MAIVKAVLGETQIELVFASQKIAADVRNQLTAQGFNATARLVKDIG